MKSTQVTIQKLRQLGAPMVSGTNHLKIFDPTGKHIVAILGLGSHEPTRRAILNVRAQLRRAGYDI